MNTKLHRNRQQGSVVVNLLSLAVAAYALYIGIQWVPQFIESNTVSSIINSVVDAQKTEPAESSHEVKRRIENLLNVNQMYDLADAFSVHQNGRDFTIDVKYERELNLLFDKRVMDYSRQRKFR